MLTRLIALLPLFICRMLGIPVPYSRLFPEGSVDAIKGQVLLGDSAMPATVIKGASDDRNKLRNARLAKTAWRTWTLFHFEEQHVAAAHVMYGTDQVLLTALRTTFVAVRNGAEDCRFAVLDSRGEELGFEVISRGDRETLERELRRWLREHGHRVPVYELLNDLVTFV